MLRNKNSPLELEKKFKDLKKYRIKRQGNKIRKEIEELFLKSINVSKDDMDKLEERKMTTVCMEVEQKQENQKSKTIPRQHN